MTYTEIIKALGKYMDLIDIIELQQAEIDNLTYTLLGVMHSVDKWLDGAELEQDEVNRAATMREKTLRIVEEKQAEIERLENINDENFDKWKMLADKTKDHYNDLYEEAKEILKSEVINKFADKAKEKMRDLARVDYQGIAYYLIDDLFFDNLVKEMGGAGVGQEGQGGRAVVVARIIETVLDGDEKEGEKR